MIPIAIVGLGKIALDQHVPVINASSEFELVATASRSASLPGVPAYPNLSALLEEGPKVEAISLCLPPAPRFEIAMAAIKSGKHVLLEKPPGVTLQEVEALKNAATKAGVTLHASWHSRHAAGVAPTKALLASHTITAIEIEWREDVEKWHPGQDWIWEAGGMGVFDPGINALSILTELIGPEVEVRDAQLTCPPGKPMPITAELEMSSRGIPLSAVFDWRPTPSEVWQIRISTDHGSIVLDHGGATLMVDGESRALKSESEYEGVYHHFAKLVRDGASEVDASPLAIIEAVFAL